MEKWNTARKWKEVKPHLIKEIVHSYSQIVIILSDHVNEHTKYIYIFFKWTTLGFVVVNISKITTITNSLIINFLAATVKNHFRNVSSHATNYFFGMVPTKHYMTVHGVDWAQPTGHGPAVHGLTVHENNRAPCRLSTPPVETIVHQTTVHRVDCARSTGYGSTAHGTTVHHCHWTQCPQCKLGTSHLCTESIVHDRLSTIQSFTNTNGHRDDWTHHFLSNWARDNWILRMVVRL